MSDTRRSDGEPIDSAANKGVEEQSEIIPEGPGGPTTPIGSLRDAELKSSEASIEREFGFAPGIELAGKRDGNSSKAPDKLGFGFASEIELSTKRDTPPARKPLGRRCQTAQPAAPFLPYEAAKLTASASLLQKPRLDGKLAPVCLAVIISTVCVVSAATVWSAYDGRGISPLAHLSVANNDASEKSLLNKDVQTKVQAPKLDKLIAAAPKIEPAARSTGLPMVSDERESLPESSVVSSTSSIENSAALTSVETNEADGPRDQAKASAAPKSSAIGIAPATLVAAAGSRSTIDLQTLAIAKQDQLESIDTRPNRNRDDPPALREDRTTPQTELSPRPEFRPLKIATSMSAIYLSRQPQLPPTPELKPLEIATTIGSSRPIGEVIFRPVLKPRDVALVTTTPVAPTQTERQPILVRFWRSLVGSLTNPARNRDGTSRVLLAANNQDDDDRRGNDDDNGSSSDSAGNGSSGENDNDNGSSSGSGGNGGGKGGNGKGGGKGGNSKGKK